MQTLSIEGAKSDIRVNSLAPTAATRMTEDLMTEAVLAALKPEAVVPAMLVLVSTDAPTRTILCAGAGSVGQRSTRAPGRAVGHRGRAQW
jgi:NAD(P)-dependent dehydrogenase (short-subunit alcohol dehydrogenase family)